MAILLDTNVVSELMRPSPDAGVKAWITSHALTDLYFSSVSEAELRYGVALLPTGKRKDRLKAEVAAMLQNAFQNRVLNFDRKSARTYAEIAASRQLAGRPFSRFDCQIASIASTNDFVLATRNIRDFVGMGITLVNPWSNAQP